jgi:4-hydroxybenzoate polyprenyltransferase
MGMNISGYIKSVFSSIRAGNLLIICLSLYLIRYTLIIPLLEFGNIESSLTSSAYTLLVLSIVFIAAGGYIINDYFDSGIDAINKPGKNKIGNDLPRKNTLTFYFTLTLSGLFAAWLFGEMAGFRYPLLVMLVCSGLLYFYSATYKKMFLVGNVIISLLTGLTIYLPVYLDINARLASPIVVLITAYSIFAFLLTMTREIIKDCEDVAGDQAFGASTLPIVAGKKTARIVAAVFTLITFCGLLWIQILQQQWGDLPSFLYVSIFIQLPLLFLVYKILTAKSKAEDHFNSNLSKFIMVTGIFSMLVFYITSR